MKINAINNSLSFKKKLEAKCCVLKDSKPYSCKIYSLDAQKDSDYFMDYSRSLQWQKSIYWKDMDEELKYFTDHEKFYVMEDKNNDCLGFIKVLAERKKLPKSVIFFETNPQYASSNSNRNIKYIGETLLAFVTKLAQKDESFMVNISIPTSDSIPFYRDKCGFNSSQGTGLVLVSDNYKKLIEQNELHTGKKIRLRA